MIDIKTDDKDVTIRFPKDLISENCLERLLERLEVEALASKNKMTEEQAWELSEEIKQSWWKNNEASILERIKNR